MIHPGYSTIAYQPASGSTGEHHSMDECHRPGDNCTPCKKNLKFSRFC